MDADVEKRADRSAILVQLENDDDFLNFLRSAAETQPIAVEESDSDDLLRLEKQVLEFRKQVCDKVNVPADLGATTIGGNHNQTFAEFDSVLTQLKKCLLARSVRERRRANELEEGGIAPTPESNEHLNRIRTVVVQCAELLLQVWQKSQSDVQCHVNTIARLKALVRATFVVTALSSQILKKNKNVDVDVELLSASVLSSKDAQFSASVTISVASEEEMRLAQSRPAPRNKNTAVRAILRNAELVPDAARRRAKRKKLGASAAAGQRAQAAVGKWLFTLKRDQSAKDLMKTDAQSSGSSEAKEKSKRLTRKPSASAQAKQQSEPNNLRRPSGGNGNSRPAVTEVKWAVVFDLSVVFLNNRWQFRYYSMPVVLVSHSKQQCLSWCTLFWDNAFSAESRQEFDVPLTVLSERFLDALQQWFQGRSKRPLDEAQLTFLKRCLPETVTIKALTETSNSNELLGFEFWPWFYKCSQLISGDREVSKFWQNGWLQGFISVPDACTILRHGQCGSSLLRFSTHSKKGAITVLRHERDELTEQHSVKKYGCWKKRDLDQRGLYRTLFDFEITHLVPHVLWMKELRLSERDLICTTSEEDKSDGDFEHVHTCLRRCSSHTANHAANQSMSLLQLQSEKYDFLMIG